MLLLCRLVSSLTLATLTPAEIPIPNYVNLGVLATEVRARGSVSPKVKILVSMKWKTTIFYTAVVQAGKMPPVKKPSDLTPSTQNIEVSVTIWGVM